MKRLLQSCLFLTLGLMAVVASAKKAPVIVIQGKLTSSAGRPLTGTRAWRVQFYDAPTGGNPVGEVRQGAIAVAASGRFAIELSLPTLVLAPGSLYYELAVDSALTPDGAIDPADVFPARVKFNSVLSAHLLTFQGPGSNLNADLLDGAHATTFVTTSTLAAQLAGKAGTSHAHTLSALSGAVTDAQVPNNITITERDTLASVTARGASTAQALTLTNATNSNSTVTGALQVAGGVGIGRNLNVGGQVIVKRQLDVEGRLYHDGVRAFSWKYIYNAGTQTESNCGYLVYSNDLTTVTLPPDPSMGDVVRVSGSGPGAWKIAQNAGQQILLDGLEITQPLTPRLTDANRNWTALASSADGTRLLASDVVGGLYISSDSGATWAPHLTDENRGWSDVASSADGTRLAACIYGGPIYTSTDSGTSWTARNPMQGWMGIASSADGTRLAACATSDYIYTSTDAGTTWTARLTDAQRDWTAIASSADGARLAACAYGGYIYTSTDSGTTWTARLTAAPRRWQCIASSADGTRLVAGTDTGELFTSSDAGATWIARSTGASHGWFGVAASADGTRLAACASNDHIYTSSDSGITWTARKSEASRPWTSIALSADGARLAAGVMGGFLYTGSTIERMQQTTAGPAGYLSGGRGTAVELQYVDTGLFMPLSHNGTLDAR